MQFHCVLFSLFLICQSLMSISGQDIDGRHYRPKPPKCQSGCSDDDDRNYKPPRDEYRSIPIDGGSNIDKDLKIEKGFDSMDEYAHKVTSGDRIPGDGGYNRKPAIDMTNYNPPKPVRYPAHGTAEFIPKPVRGGYIPSLDKPIDDAIDKYDHKVASDDKVTGDGGYNRKPEIDTTNYSPSKPAEYPSHGSGGYNPRPVRGGYRPSLDRPTKPSIDRDFRPPTDSGYRPSVDRPSFHKPSIDRDVHRPDIHKPAVDRDNQRPGIHKPSNDRDALRPGLHKPDHPVEPSYPNKDLGGYEEPKDDDYNDDHGNIKEKPVVDIGNCICVPYYQCQEGHIVTDGAGIIDARKKPEPEGELPLDGKFRPPTCGPFHVCCNTPETSTVKPYEHRCGVRNPSGINSRILSPSNKGEADFGEWPWQAAVLKAEGKVNIFQCGGVLIDKLHVLTVAHCVFHLYKYNEYPLKVRLGEWDTQTTTEFLAHEDYSVSKIIVHPEFRNDSLWNDIAILRLEEPVLFAPHIDTVCLPQYDDVFADHNCVVTGWGKDAYKGGTFSNIMKEVALQVIDNYKCEEMLRKTRLGRFFQLHPGFMCAGGEYGLDSCKGDGGGPLVCYRKDRSYALAGIVSWGIDCGQPGVPGVYVKIQKYLDWISQNTGQVLPDYWPKH